MSAVGQDKPIYSRSDAAFGFDTEGGSWGRCILNMQQSRGVERLCLSYRHHGCRAGDDMRLRTMEHIARATGILLSGSHLPAGVACVMGAFVFRSFFYYRLVWKIAHKKTSPFAFSN